MYRRHYAWSTAAVAHPAATLGGPQDFGGLLDFKLTHYRVSKTETLPGWRPGIARGARTERRRRLVNPCEVLQFVSGAAICIPARLRPRY